jgi:hypothetical protein
LTNSDNTAASNELPTKEIVEEKVGDTGATLEFEGGTSLEIPPEALTEEVDVTLTEVEEVPQPVDEDLEVVADTLILEPHGQVFEEPLTLNIAYTKDPAIPFHQYQVLRLANEEDDTWEVVENAFPGEDGNVEFTIQTFSVITVAVRAEACVDSTCVARDDYYRGRFLSCVGSGRDTAYCAQWMGCSGSIAIDAPNGTVVGNSDLCEHACTQDPCANGTCSLDDNGEAKCTCAGGFEGALCDTATDLCPGDDTKELPGVCGCGVADVDMDSDGVADCHDDCPEDATKSNVGACGCNASDVDTDGDGKVDCEDGCPQDADKLGPGTCGCGIADTDGDGDGTADCEDSCSEDSNKSEVGVCGCGVADTDSDSDGTPDCNDGCDNDASKTAAGECGCGVAEGTCAVTCPCFDASLVGSLVGSPESSCYVDIAGDGLLSSEVSGTQGSLYIQLNSRSYTGGGYSCFQECFTQDPAASCANVPTISQSISQAEHQACRQFFVDNQCPNGLP